VRVLTIRQPWATASAHGPKRVENRTWSTRYRGPLLIHAAARADRHAADFFAGEWPDVRSAVIAVVDLADVHAGDRCGSCCPVWAEPRAVHWVLDRVRALTVPIPATGRLGLWTPPADLLTAVNHILTPEGPTHA
jgi:hypothetical protein